MNDLIPTVQEMRVITTAVKSAIKSNLTKGKSEEQGMAIALYAREIGLPIMQSLLGGVNIINGVAEISARMMNNLIRQKGHQINCIKCDNEICILKGVRKDTGEECEVTFTFEEAEKAGLVKNGGAWFKWTQDMLYARAASRLARRLFPDVIGTMYVEGEVSAEKSEKKGSDIQLADVDQKLTKDQVNHVKNLLKDHKELREELLKEFGKDLISDIYQCDFDKLLTLIQERVA